MYKNSIFRKVSSFEMGLFLGLLTCILVVSGLPDQQKEVDLLVNEKREIHEKIDKLEQENRDLRRQLGEDPLSAVEDIENVEHAGGGGGFG